jgi:hypothetical protein
LLVVETNPATQNEGGQAEIGVNPEDDLMQVHERLLKKMGS